MTISRRRQTWATALALLGAACGGRTVPVDATGAPVVTRPDPRPLSRVFLLESWGVPAEDTVVTFPAAAPRVILLRRGAPDNSVFAEVRLPPGVVSPPEGRPSTTMTLLPRPGAFGVDILLEDGARMRPGATLTFSYAVHFVMPAGAGARYGSPIAFERQLFIGQVGGDELVTFLPTTRPASDNLSAELTGPGRYVVAAPR